MGTKHVERSSSPLAPIVGTRYNPRVLVLPTLLDKGRQAKDARHRTLVGKPEAANRTDTKVVSARPQFVGPTCHALLQEEGARLRQRCRPPKRQDDVKPSTEALTDR